MNKRKKILVIYLKLFSLVLFFLALKSLYFKTFAERIFPAYYPKIIYHKEILQNADQDYETLILGDSLGTFNIKSSQISDSTLNLSTFGATFVEVYWSLERYLEKNKSPSRIILLNGQNWDYKREHEFWPFYVGLGFYGIRDLLKIEYQEPHSSILTFSKWLYFSTGIPNYDFGQLRTSLLKGDIIQKYNTYLQTLLKNDNGSVVLKKRFPPNRPLIQPYHQHYQSDFVVNPTNDFYFKKVLELAAKNKIEVVMIEPPLMLSVSNKEQILKFREKMTHYYQETLRPYQFKYCQDHLTTYEDEDFFDIDHLLEAGAVKFALFVKSCL